MKIVLIVVLLGAELGAPYSNPDNGTIEYVLLDSGSSCARRCVKNTAPMVCRFSFTVESYHTMSKACFNCPHNASDCYSPDCIPGDGTKRSITVINRQLPGPAIEVCLGDEVIIDVTNSLSSETTTIHWHGHHQKESPYMDGVPFVTQCPIQPLTAFRYQFNVNNAGTHFWHSHAGFQRSDGAFGAFIVRVPPEDDPHAHLYDFDLTAHVISVLDWTIQTGIEKFTDHHHSSGDNKPDNILVNGLGRFKSLNGSYTPRARFTVEAGFRYRFRVINAGFLNCPVEIHVDNHTLLVVSSDGSDFNPVEVNSLVTYAGERYDFILKASQPPGDYWMRFKGLMDGNFTKAFQTAVLHYKGSQRAAEGEPSYDNTVVAGRQLGPLNQGTEAAPNLVSLPQLKSLSGKDDTLKDVADFQYYLSYDFYKKDNPYFHKPPYGFNNFTNRTDFQLLTPQFNYISMKVQPFPLLSQRDEIKENSLCNETSVKNCQTEFCECTHVVDVPLDAVVEMIIIDKGYAYDANHPFHLHGSSFRVVAMQHVGSHVNVSQVRDMDLNGAIKRNLIDAPIKDTVCVPDGGFTIIRFKAINPGYWLFHCHIEFHVEVGMSLIFKVGTHAEMPPVPAGFPKCGNFPSNATTVPDCDTFNYFLSIFEKWLPKDYQNKCASASTSSRKRASGAIFALILLRIFL